jgi:phosphoribosylformylglycinamidine cyclo-ligase
MSEKLTYKDAGVDIDAGDALVDRIKTLSEESRRMGVISRIGGYAGLFSLANHHTVKNPVLVATTDGVGTKLKIAIDLKKYDTIGQDLVAMCVNDLICCGAEPLFFLDYYATGKLNVDEAAQVIASISSSLKTVNCALLGGETAEMPGLYHDRDFDLAGFAVGIVDKNKVIDGSHVSIGNKVIALASTGLHSNGYSLARKIIAKAGLKLNAPLDFTQQSLGEVLLTPTALYVNSVLNLLKNFDIAAMAHITGGGLVENLPRVMPKKCQVVIQKQAINTPQIFHYLQNAGYVPEDEMFRVFNMGVGFVIVVRAEDETPILEQLAGMNQKAKTIGTIEEKKTPSDLDVEIV